MPVLISSAGCRGIADVRFPQSFGSLCRPINPDHFVRLDALIGYCRMYPIRQTYEIHIECTEHHPRVRTSALIVQAQEIPAVMGQQDSVLAGRERKHLCVGAFPASSDVRTSCPSLRNSETSCSATFSFEIEPSH